MSVVINILAIIGLIIIISYLIYYIWIYFKYQSIKNHIAYINPPGQYMQNSGIKCPDYWVNTGVDANGNYICKNSFAIQTQTNSKCNSDTMSFTPIDNGKTWEYNNPYGLTSYSDNDKYNFVTNNAVPGSVSRCDWINKCGPSSNIQGIWSGVNEVCNSPPISS